MPLGYEKEMEALVRSNRVRQRVVRDGKLIDCASNDYLGCASMSLLKNEAMNRLKAYDIHGAGASVMVNGYHEIHENFERDIALFSNAPCAMVVGSGFLANIAIIEAMVRRGDVLVLDREYHASGVLASRLVQGDVVYFNHNDAEDLRKVLLNVDAKRVIVAVEGIYSMSGERVTKEVIETIKEFDAYMVLDEAHSVGVVGDDLSGVLSFYGIAFEEWIIKMGTLGKAFGSYGAYIAGSKSMIQYIENRAKSVIYSTALSLFDTAVAHEALNFIKNNTTTLCSDIKERQALSLMVQNNPIKGLILPVVAPSNSEVLQWGETLKKEGFHVGTIRQPTVEQPMLRIILRSCVSLDVTKKLLQHVVALRG